MSFGLAILIVGVPFFLAFIGLSRVLALAEGRLLAPRVSAMMDVSDGLLLDAMRMAQASGVTFAIDREAVPIATSENRRDEALRWGDDYQLLFTAARPLPALPCPVTRIGQIVRGSGIHLHDREGAVPLPHALHDGIRAGRVIQECNVLFPGQADHDPQSSALCDIQQPSWWHRVAAQGVDTVRDHRRKVLFQDGVGRIEAGSIGMGPDGFAGLYTITSY